MSLALIIVAVKWIAGTVIALLSTGGVIKLIEMRSNRPEAQAKARAQNVTAETEIVERWRVYADRVEERFNKLESGYKLQIEGLEKKIDDERIRHDLIIGRKDREIDVLRLANGKLEEANGKLTDTITELREQNHILRNKLQEYMPMTTSTIESAKAEHPSHLDETLDAIEHATPPGGHAVPGIPPQPE